MSVWTPDVCNTGGVRPVVLMQWGLGLVTGRKVRKKHTAHLQRLAKG